jgi:hypothetical protein
MPMAIEMSTMNFPLAVYSRLNAGTTTARANDERASKAADIEHSRRYKERPR